MSQWGFSWEQVLIVLLQLSERMNEISLIQGGGVFLDSGGVFHGRRHSSVMISQASLLSVPGSNPRFSTNLVQLVADFLPCSKRFSPGSLSFYLNKNQHYQILENSSVIWIKRTCMKTLVGDVAIFFRRTGTCASANVDIPSKYHEYFLPKIFNSIITLSFVITIQCSPQFSGLQVNQFSRPVKQPV